jgi:hypothetical protein
MNSLLSILFCTLSLSAYSQTISSFHFEDESLESFAINFKEINNLILIPLSLNGSDTLYFILDSGAENITLFSSEFKTAPLDTNYLRKVKVVGAGKEKGIVAYVSPLNDIRFGGIVGDNQTIVYIPDSTIKFSDLLGHPVHGILGIPIFKSFVIEINYTNNQVIFHKQSTFQPKRKFSEIELTIMGNRPFIELNMELQPRINLFTTLLVDSGESKPLSLFLNSNEMLFIPYPNYYTNLGKGLNGLVTGRIAKITSINLDEYIINEVITAFPDEENIIHLTDGEERNGSIGAGILKKFTSIFDLQNEKLYLKRNKFYKYPYKYDKTGIIIVAEGLLYDYFRISGVVEGSAGDKAGAKENDRILKINGVDLAYKKIGEVMQLLDDSGRTVELEVLRNQKIIQIKVHNYRL